MCYYYIPYFGLGFGHETVTPATSEAIDTAVIATRANGTYQAATAKAKTLAIAAAAAQGQTGKAVDA